MSKEDTTNTSEDEKAIDSSNEETTELSEPEITRTQEEILQDELKACEEKYIRVHAEFDNIKKRLEREKVSAIEYATEKFARDLIPVLDALGMAVESAKTDTSAGELLEKLTEGVQLTMKQFLTTLEKHGVKEVQYGELDPNVHEAVMQVSSDEVESGHIVQVMQKGYTFKDRTLRAAMVSVAN